MHGGPLAAGAARISGRHSHMEFFSSQLRPVICQHFSRNYASYVATIKQI